MFSFAPQCLCWTLPLWQLLTHDGPWRSRLKKRIWQNDFGMQGMCDKGSVASVTRNRRPRAGSNHQLSLFRALSSSPLSEPSLKELHTCRPPYGLNPKARREYFWQLLPLQLQVLDSLVKKLSKTWSVGSLFWRKILTTHCWHGVWDG